ncbi:PEP-CTERM sorting domain-containing protein [Noviherbaspirillum galbum]|uniref:PEP-CTERM sorting domain-containing protein n=1 Tax=Noviherbaspirillum galbum TaxID=2709383 RepID=A0A6B3SHU0_9BURK|nr:PEP-CTERM sorting domain-containing protein [Noviherbaspirillum galbum]NEX60233.1 PEP-CTERM sorting domain-containing protein [Noviherbaspirillum galbum]
MTYRMLLRVLAFMCSFFAVSAAHPAIINNPVSIHDHNSYISDTVHKLEWYKFNNTDTTVGLSLNQVRASDFYQSGNWRVASGAEVNGLWSEFGWTEDTPSAGTNSNDGLVDALANYLGSTFTYKDAHNDAVFIDAITTEPSWVEGYDLSFARMIRNNSDNDATSGHDYVLTRYSAWSSSFVVQGIGTWLVRDMPNHAVPEPGSLMLISMLLFAIVCTRRRS